MDKLRILPSREAVVRLEAAAYTHECEPHPPARWADTIRSVSTS
jgi:hypothetical protein